MAHISHRRLSLFLFRSMVATRITPPLLCQRSFLLGCPVPIRQGARPFKTPREHETEPGWDVSWLPHLPVSGLVKLLSWGVTLGVQCVQIKCVCVCVHVHFAEGRQTQHHSFEQSEPHTTWWPCPFNLYASWHFHQNWPNLKKIKNLISHQGKLAAVFTGEDFFFFKWRHFRGIKCAGLTQLSRILSWIEVNWSHFRSAHFLWTTVGGGVDRTLNCLKLVSILFLFPC